MLTQKKRRHLQLIQDIEQEIRYNAKHHSQPDRVSMVQSDTSMVAFNDGVATNRMSDIVRSQSDCTACSPAAYLPNTLGDISMGLSDGSCKPLENSSGKQIVSPSGSSPSRLEQKAKVCTSTIDTPEASSAVHQASPLSAAGMDSLSTAHVSSERDRSIPGGSEEGNLAFHGTCSPASYSTHR